MSNKVREALKGVGILVYDAWDFVNTNKSYPEAIPVLIELLEDKSLSEPDLEGIVRALTVKEAKGKAESSLVKLYQRVNKDGTLAWAIGNALRILNPNKEFDAIKKIVLDKNNAVSRQMFVLSLGKIKSSESEDILIELLNDDDVKLHAISALSKLKSKKAKMKLESLLNDPRSSVKREAKNALKKIG